MTYFETEIRTSRDSEARENPHRSMRAHPLARLLTLMALSGLLLSTAIRADTIFLKDGSFIGDCQVTKETATEVHVHTNVGDMVVPRDKIYRILRQKTVYDTFKEQRRKVREGDFNGLYKLALWCRSRQGLRKESDELLADVIALKKDHTGARRLLGHLRIDGEWVVPDPLSIELRVPDSAGEKEETLRKQLGLLLKSRKDVRLVENQKGNEADPLDACTFDASVVISRASGSRLYGVPMGTPALAASVQLEAKSAWIGRRPLKVAMDGQVPATGGDKANSQAIQSALGMGSQRLHKFLDQLAQLRAKHLVKALREKSRESEASESD